VVEVSKLTGDVIFDIKEVQVHTASSVCIRCETRSHLQPKMNAIYWLSILLFVSGELSHWNSVNMCVSGRVDSSRQRGVCSMPKGPMKFLTSRSKVFVAWLCLTGETGKQLQAMFAHFQFSKKFPQIGWVTKVNRWRQVQICMSHFQFLNLSG
jgi:hypothetical protein